MLSFRSRFFVSQQKLIRERTVFFCVSISIELTQITFCFIELITANFIHLFPRNFICFIENISVMSPEGDNEERLEFRS